MTEIQAFLLGLLQGLTEFLPVSSSGHIELGIHLFNIRGGDDLIFTITVHAATVLSTILVFRKEFMDLIRNGLTFRKNKETVYLLKLLFSSIPVAFIGLFFREQVESLFTGNLLVVGTCLLITATLLTFAHFSKAKSGGQISWSDSFIIGIAQALAVLPGLSRSGSTIATGILLGNDRKEVAKFSFLMVILPVLGVVILDLIRYNFNDGYGIGSLPLVIGFVTAFVSGFLACSWMIKIVSKGKLIYFALYCFVIGLISFFIA
jgi:undecaprenyl-diphosphatase